MDNTSSLNENYSVAHPAFQDHRTSAEIGIQVFAVSTFNIVAFFGNLLIIWAIHTEPTLRNTTNKIIESLAWTDFLSSFLVTPLFTVSLAKGKWVFGNTVCWTQGFLLITLAVATVDTVAVVAINRLLKVVFPDSYNKFFGTPRKTNLIIICVWGLSVSLALIPFIGWRKSYVYDPQYFLCDVVWDHANLAYTTILLLLSGYSATAIITVSYAWIYIQYRRSSNNVKSHAKGGDIENIRLQLRQQQAENKVLMLTVAMVSFFIICWSPIIVLVTVIPHVNTIPARVKTATKIIMSLNSAGNPIIYCAFNMRFRTAFKRILTRQAPGKDKDTPVQPRKYRATLSRHAHSLRRPLRLSTRGSPI